MFINSSLDSLDGITTRLDKSTLMQSEGVSNMIKTHVDQTVRLEKSLRSLVSFCFANCCF